MSISNFLQASRDRQDQLSGINNTNPNVLVSYPTHSRRTSASGSDPHTFKYFWKFPDTFTEHCCLWQALPLSSTAQGRLAPEFSVLCQALASHKHSRHLLLGSATAVLEPLNDQTCYGECERMLSVLYLSERIHIWAVKQPFAHSSTVISLLRTLTSTQRELDQGNPE